MSRLRIGIYAIHDCTVRSLESLVFRSWLNMGFPWRNTTTEPYSGLCGCTPTQRIMPGDGVIAGILWQPAYVRYRTGGEEH